MSKTNRIAAIDALRGFDMFWIAGGEGIVFALEKCFPNVITHNLATQMQHVPWNGLHFYDIIFPLFLFLAGVSTTFSVESSLKSGISKTKLHLKFLKRLAILVFLGLIFNDLFRFDFENMRYASVLARIALAWYFAALIRLYGNSKSQMIWFASLLLGYWVLIMFIPVPGFEEVNLSPESTWVAYIDQHYLPGKLFFEVYDPEGILSTIPAISTALLGIFCGEILQNKHSQTKKLSTLLLLSMTCLSTAYIWNLHFPIIKNI
jgi:predicted acyltransferase